MTHTAQSIREWAGRTPDKIAVRYNGRPLTYARFADLIALAQGYLARQEMAGPGFAVLAVPNRLDAWILGLALRGLGLTTIAIPSAEAAASVRLAEMCCVVTVGAAPWPDLAPLCDERGWRLISVVLEGERGGAPPPDAAVPGGNILRTSGTTGDHKLILIDPAFEAGFLAKRRALLGIDADSVLGGFDFPCWTGAGYKMPACVWQAGGTVSLRQGGMVYETLCEPDLTHAALIPNMLAAALAAPEGMYPRSERLHLSLVGGTVTQAQIDLARRRITPWLYNRLGATETSIFGFTRLEEDGDQRWHRPVPGCPVEIVDDLDSPVPAGTIGRLRVGTAGGPTSYLGDARATAAMFRDGYFYPGDLAVARSDGRIALQGRTTDVINIGGHKIGPAPIEDRLRELLGLSGVCLVSLQNGAGAEELHVVIEGESPVDPDALRRELDGSIGSFGTAFIHHVAKLPRNDMGKVVRRAVQAGLAGRTRFVGA